MKQLLSHLSANKSRYQKITFLLLVVFPLVMYFGARMESTVTIIISLIFIISANILAIINK